MRDGGMQRKANEHRNEYDYLEGIGFDGVFDDAFDAGGLDVWLDSWLDRWLDSRFNAEEN